MKLALFILAVLSFLAAGQPASAITAQKQVAVAFSTSTLGELDPVRQ